MSKLFKYLPVVFLLSCGTMFGQLRVSRPNEKNSLIRFTENKNQWDDFIKYRAQLDGGALYVKNNSLTYGFYDKETYRKNHDNPSFGTKRSKRPGLKFTGFDVNFVNSNPNTTIESTNPTKDYCNFFIGNNPHKWAGNVKNYTRLLYNDLWQGINLEIIGGDNSAKYNFYLKPGANPTDIKLHYNRLEKISLHNKEIVLQTTINEMVEHEPYAYQIINGKTVDVPCAYELKNKTVSFVFPKGYNKEYELIIDPVLVFAASSGSVADNFGFTGTFDAKGNLYSGSIAFFPGYPVVNAYDSTYNGVTVYGISPYDPSFPTPDSIPDVVITKYDSTGTFLHYSTYIGGAHSCETVSSIIVDSQNDLYLFGATGSYDFPTTPTAYDTSFNGGGPKQFFTGSGTHYSWGSDLYVAKLSPGGNQLLASTFIGGSGNDGLNLNNLPSASGGEAGPDSMEYNYGDQYRGNIEFDKAGFPIITSCSRSSDFPTKNAFDNTLGGWQDAVVFKFDPNLTQLQWSTFVGGSNNDGGYGSYVGKNDEVYITGGTRSSDFPMKPSAYNPTYGGGDCDGYIAKLSRNGDSLLASTYMGTNKYDQSFFIQLDKSEDVYVFGQSLGSMSVTPSSIYKNAGSTQFVSKLNNKLTSLIYQTVIGNGDSTAINISPTAFLVDNCQNVYLAGWGGNFKTNQPTFNMPIAPNSIDSTNVDGFNFYMMQLSRDCNSLLFTTYYGGDQSFEHVHGGTSRYDKRGIVYQSLCSGCGGKQDFPITPGAWPTVTGGLQNGSNCNNATFKIAFTPNIVIASYVANKTGCQPLTVNFTENSTNATSYLWNFGGGDTTSSVLNPIRTYTAVGTYTAQLIAYNPTTCNLSDTTVITITVYPAAHAAFTAVYDSCVNRVTYINGSTLSAGTLFSNWNFGNGTTSTVTNPPAVTYAQGTYTASLLVTSDHGCKDSVKKVSSFNIAPVNSFPDTAICFGKNVQLNASGGLSYSWAPAAGLSSTTSSAPVATPTASTIYTVTIHQVDGGGRTCDKTLTDSIIIHPQVTAVFSYVKNKCGNTLQFTDSSYATVNSWDWNFGDSNTDTIQNPAHSYSAAGTYTITLIADNQYGCKDSTKKVVTLSGFTPISVSASTFVCINSPIQLHATGGISYTWAPAGNLDNPHSANPIATPSTTTHYTVSITAINGADTCISVLHTNISVAVYTPTVLATFAHPDTIYSGQSTQLGSYAPGGNITWNPPYNISSTTTHSPTAWPGHTTTYSAIYTDSHGCTFPLSSITVYVIAKDCNESTVFVPNTFTPNDDGVNDILYARSSLITEIEFQVADRWGQIVFYTKDITKGWDGIFKGKPCNPDVFGYWIKYTCNNGKESFRKGNVTLIR
jgi:gliding motility-associated-like protein